MDLRDEKRRLIESVIDNYVDAAGFMPHAMKMNVAAPMDMIKRWQHRFFDTKAIEFPVEPKLINRFSVGADPEFAFLNKLGSKAEGPSANNFVHASTLGMSVSEPFGSDLCGRQAEVRAHPSRFIVEVVASLVDTLRWIPALHSVSPLYWYAGAMIGNDGVGGHIHFGRKRPNIANSVNSLDNLTQIMYRENLAIDGLGQKIRMNKTKYGQYGDIRPQSYGYEYRTMPTWLDSPLTAYLTLVWAKLAVLYDLKINPQALKTNRGYTMLRNLLHAYAGRDDDARIALRALDTFGVPKFVAADFQRFWGVPHYGPPKFKIDRTYFPSTIAPSQSTIIEVFRYLTQGTPIPLREPTAYWEPFELPFNVHKLTAPLRTAGTGEVVQGLLSHDVQTSVIGSVSKGQMRVDYSPTSLTLPVEAIKKFASKLSKVNAVSFTTNYQKGFINISLPKNLAQAYHADDKIVADIRAILKSGLFPITTAEGIENHDARQFVAVKKKAEFVGRVELQIRGKQAVGPEAD
jgi:hypothetical protein